MDFSTVAIIAADLRERLAQLNVLFHANPTPGLRAEIEAAHRELLRLTGRA